MAKNLSTNTQRIVDEYSTNTRRRIFIRRRRIFNLNLIFSATPIFSVFFKGLWTCFRKKRLKLIKIKEFFAGEEKLFVEYSLNIRQLIVDKILRHV